ncbi:MAG: NAD-dependent epimerase/dehydratase family protein, partial [Gammaproteobacteria bacterium]
MKVFVTGIAGLVGSHLADALLAEGHEVVGCDNLSGGYRDNVPSDAEFHQCDVIDRASMLEHMRGCELVYHCAATAYEGLSVFSPAFVTANIVQASVSTVSAAIANGARRLVFCSSMARYGTQERVPFTEDMTPKPQDPYGIAKYGSELMLRNLCEVHGMEYVIVVPHNIVGPRQKYDDPYRSVASIMINRMLQDRQPIIYGDGTQKRCFSFVQDVVDPLVKVGTSEGLSGEVINIGPDDDFITINELAERIARIIDFDL